MKKMAELLKQRKAAKRKARGFKTFDRFASMIYFVVGKLKLDCPS